MQLTLRDMSAIPDFDKFNIRDGEEVMIYYFIVRFPHALNLLDFFERFKDYVRDSGLAVRSSFDFTRWLMEDEKVAFQDMRSGPVNLETIRKFNEFQNPWLIELGLMEPESEEAV